MSALDRDKMLELLAAYGADLSRWPEDFRDTAADFLNRADQALLDRFSEEEELDTFLSVADDPVLPIALEEDLLREAPLPKSQGASKTGWLQGLLRPSAPRWAAVSGMALAMVFGAGAGYAGARSDAFEAEAVDAYAYVASDVSGIFEALSFNAEEESS